jgi:hypothetical protein
MVEKGISNYADDLETFMDSLQESVSEGFFDYTLDQ